MTTQYKHILPGSRTYIRVPWGLCRQEPCRQPQRNRCTKSTGSQDPKLDVDLTNHSDLVQTVSADTPLVGRKRSFRGPA